jgi:adenine-specific DNA-methyltransferase
VKNGIVVTDVTVLGRFVWSQDFFDNELKNGTRISLSNKFGFNVLRFNQESKTKTPSTLINDQNGVGTNEDASLDLQKIFKSGVNEVFQYSKPHSLIEYLINMLCKEDSHAIILDSFAGSGTTAHAVLNLNKSDGGNRKFILVEMEDYAETITAERVRRVIDGYGDTEGTGGSFDFYELGEPVFNADGYLNENIGTEKLRDYIWYSETRVGLQAARLSIADEPSALQPQSQYLLGNLNGTAYYFYYEPDQITTLSHETLSIVIEEAETYVIYADQCAIDGEWLAAHNIIFKKIPRDIRKF